MPKKLAIINSENKEIIESIKNYFIDKNVEITVLNTLEDGFDIVVLTGFETQIDFTPNCKILNLYPALLPSFIGGEPIKDSFLSGVKVSGITIHEVNQDNFYDRILAQYPVLIGTTTHINEYTEELIAVSKKLYPVVIDSVLNDKVFDFGDLFKSSCGGSCGNCGGCHKG